MSKLLALSIFGFSMGFCGSMILEPLISPTLEQAARDWVKRELAKQEDRRNEQQRGRAHQD